MMVYSRENADSGRSTMKATQKFPYKRVIQSITSAIEQFNVETFQSIVNDIRSTQIY